jgi:voltage-gated potassium channel
LNVKKRIFEIIEKAEDGDIPSIVFDVAIIALIILNIAAVTAASFDNFANTHVTLLGKFEVFSIAVFSVEYLLRVWTAKNKFPDSKIPHIRLIFSFSAMIDLVAILPFYLPFSSIDLRFLRILTIIMIFVASTVMYYVESPSQPDVFKNILETTWWSIATFTTIWLGDVYPITITGKICGGIISLLGIMLIALPSGIICSGFMNELGNAKRICPHCGKEIE